MNTLVPLEYYYPLYINTFLFLILFTLLHTALLKLDDKKNLVFIQVTGYILLIIVILYLGQRPISGKYFGDMRTYSKFYDNYLMGGQVNGSKDLLFHFFMKAVSNFASVHTFFTLVVIMYVVPLYKLSKNLFKEYWYYAFVMFVVSFSFYTYGTNGIRNGVATSFFLLALCYRKNKYIMIFIFLLAVSFHKTMSLPIIAFTLTYFYNDSKLYFKAWLACIPLSLLLGSVFTVIFSSLGFDDRLAGYLSGEADSESFSSTGFRWDFLFYSSFPVFAGWFFIFKKNFKDAFFQQILNTYLVCNGFWILVIKANFSNRFAYLSWFMMGLIIIYPLLKQRMFKQQHLIIGLVVFAYFMFTFLMYNLYYN